MGTNYYVELNKCDCCKRSNRIHIGKSSWGWAFNFQAHDGKYGWIDDDDNKAVEVPTDFQVKSWQQWKEYIQDKPIIDEYGDTVDYDEFCTMVETYKSPEFVREDGRRNKDHITEILSETRYADCWSEYNNPEEHWHDADGYSFSRRYFS